jgi:anti-anti-sigma factor
VLVRRAGEVISREELQRELWPDGIFVDREEGLNTAVRKLRQSLDDDAQQPRFIETLARVGYRFIATPELSAMWRQPTLTEPAFRVSLVDDPTTGALIISCDGRLMQAAAGSLRDNVRPEIQAGRRIVLDLGGVSHIDSIGLGALVALFVSTAMSGGQLDFAQTSARVLEVLKTTGLATVFGAR